MGHPVGWPGQGPGWSRPRPGAWQLKKDENLVNGDKEGRKDGVKVVV